MTETPIFDAVRQEQGIDEMPLPPLKTHDEFMFEHAQDVWHERAEMILKGEMEPSYYEPPVPITKAAAKKAAAKPRPPRKKP